MAGTREAPAVHSGMYSSHPIVYFECGGKYPSLGYLPGSCMRPGGIFAMVHV